MSHIYDSFTEEVFPEHKIFACSYEPFWQKVREECSLKDDGLERTLALLESYIGRSPTIEETRYRLFRVHNYLCAVPGSQASPSGFRLVRKHVAAAAREKRKEYADRLEKVGKPDEWDWHTARLALRDMWLTDEGEGFLLSLFNKLSWKRGGRPGKPELRYFLGLIQETSVWTT